MLHVNPSVTAPDKQMNLAIRINNRYNFPQQSTNRRLAKR